MDDGATTPVKAKLLEFVHRLYDKRYREPLPLTARINGVMRRAFTKSDNREIRQAMTLTRRVSTLFPLNAALPLTPEDEHTFRNALEFLNKAIGATVKSPKNIFALANCIIQFKDQWNEVVDMMEGQFLEGYGPLFKEDLYINSLESLVPFLTKLRKSGKMRMLSELNKKRNCLAITTSITAYVECQRAKTLRKMRK